MSWILFQFQPNINSVHYSILCLKAQA